MAVLLLLDIVLGLICRFIISNLDDQLTAERWGNEDRAAMVSLFFTEDQTVTVDTIKKLEYTLEHAEIISTLSSDTVSTGCGVILSRAEFNGQPQKIETLQIVGRSEADYDKHKISDDSPIGKAVLGKRVGDTFIVEAPVGIMTFTVLEISSTGVFENHPEG